MHEVIYCFSFKLDFQLDEYVLKSEKFDSDIGVKASLHDAAIYSNSTIENDWMLVKM